MAAQDGLSRGLRPLIIAFMLFQASNVPIISLATGMLIGIWQSTVLSLR